MRVFITGTGTEIGKTVVTAWLCAHTGASYFKPIQTGFATDSDSETISNLAGVTTHPECYKYLAPLSPLAAARKENSVINMSNILLPRADRLVIEGAGGVLVPITDILLTTDLIKHLKVPALVVAASGLGTINHTLLTLEALRARNIQTLGVIMNGDPNPENAELIEHFSGMPVLAQLPKISKLSKEALLTVPLPAKLISALQL